MQEWLLNFLMKGMRKCCSLFAWVKSAFNPWELVLVHRCYNDSNTA